MTPTNLAAGIVLKAQIDAIDDAQAKNAIAGITAKIVVTDNAGVTILGESRLTEALGANYATECANALTALNTALANADTAANAALTAL